MERTPSGARWQQKELLNFDALILWSFGSLPTREAQACPITATSGSLLVPSASSRASIAVKPARSK